LYLLDAITLGPWTKQISVRDIAAFFNDLAAAAASPE